MGVAVGEVAQPDAHIVVHRRWNGDGERDSQDGVRQGQRIEIAIVEKEQAGGEAPKQGDGHENGAGQMGRGEDERGDEGGEFWVGKQAQDAREKKALNQELLHEGPEDVARIGPDGEKRSGGKSAPATKTCRWRPRQVQSAHPDGKGDGYSGEQSGRAHNPE